MLALKCGRDRPHEASVLTNRTRPEAGLLGSATRLETRRERVAPRLSAAAIVAVRLIGDADVRAVVVGSLDAVDNGAGEVCTADCRASVVICKHDIAADAVSAEILSRYV